MVFNVYIWSMVGACVQTISRNEIGTESECGARRGRSVISNKHSS